MTRKELHLTEDEIDEALMGIAAPDRAAHLKICALCAGKFAEFESSMANFNQASAAWSEAKSNALTRDLHQHRTPFRITSAAVWSCALVVVFAITLVLGFGIRQRSGPLAASQANVHASHSPNSSAGDVPQSQIARDDAMLRQIDAAIDATEPSPEELYGATSASASVRENSRQVQVRN